MGVGIPEAILRETSLQAFTKSPSNFVVVSVSMIALLTQRIHLMSHLYSYVRSRYLSEWDGQGIFLQYTERYTIWT